MKTIYVISSLMALLFIFEGVVDGSRSPRTWKCNSNMSPSFCMSYCRGYDCEIGYCDGGVGGMCICARCGLDPIF